MTGAYVRPPAPPTQLAAAYFTVYNTTGAGRPADVGDHRRRRDGGAAHR